MPDLMGSLGNGIRGPAPAGGILSGVDARLPVPFLVRRTRTLAPFVICCFAVGFVSLIYLVYLSLIK